MLPALLLVLAVTVAIVLPALLIPAREARLAEQLELAERAEQIRTNLRRQRADSIYRTYIV